MKKVLEVSLWRWRTWWQHQMHLTLLDGIVSYSAMVATQHPLSSNWVRSLIFDYWQVLQLQGLKHWHTQHIWWRQQRDRLSSAKELYIKISQRRVFAAKLHWSAILKCAEHDALVQVQPASCCLVLPCPLLHCLMLWACAGASGAVCTAQNAGLDPEEMASWSSKASRC